MRELRTAASALATGLFTLKGLPVDYLSITRVGPSSRRTSATSHHCPETAGRPARRPSRVRRPPPRPRSSAGHRRPVGSSLHPSRSQSSPTRVG
ncbi:hypothetical protein FM103_03975 [Corynebacterium xerosis]|nr:hypothetical protein FM103_03975 [Corynebacterium xerosis]